MKTILQRPSSSKIGSYQDLEKIIMQYGAYINKIQVARMGNLITSSGNNQIDGESYYSKFLWETSKLI